MRASPGCSSNLEKSTVRQSTRAGVPVLKRRSAKPRSSSAPESALALPRPEGPASARVSPTMMRLFKYTPVATMAALQG